MNKLIPLLLAAATLLGAGQAGAGDNTGRYYRRVLYAKPLLLDPIASGGGHEIQIMRQLFDQLVSYDKDFRWKPSLASAWHLSGNGRIYTFDLRRDVKFSDGSLMTPEDVLFSLKRAVKDPSSRYFADFYKVKGAQAFREGRSADLPGMRLSGNRLIIESYAVNPYLLTVLATPAGSVISRAAWERKELTGTGPFRLGCMNETEVRLEANGHYFRGAPKLPGVSYRIYPDKADAARDFQAGKLDDMSPYNLPQGADRSGIKRVFTNGVITFFLVLNPARPPLNDKHFRQAIASALDLDAILAGLKDAHPMLTRSTSYIPRGRVGYAPDFKGIRYDPNMAKALVKKAGYDDFSSAPAVTFMYTGNVPYTGELLEGIQRYAAAAGLKITPRKVSSQESAASVAKGDWQLGVIGWDSLYSDSYFLLGAFHSDSKALWLRRDERQIDKLLDECSLEMNPAARAKLFARLNKILVEDAHVIPLFYGDMFDGSFRQWVDGIEYPNTAFFEMPMYPVSINTALAAGRPEIPSTCLKP